MQRSLFLCLALSLLLPACEATPDRGAVAKEWSMTLRELGVRPVFPPREDLQVGDVYLRRSHPSGLSAFEHEGFLPLDVWLESLDVAAVLGEFYGKRVALPSLAGSADESARGDENETGDENDDEETEDDVPADVPRGDAPFWQQRDTARLRQVAFPDFLSIDVVSGDLRGLIPVEALNFAVGANWQGSHQVSVKIPSAVSYGVPARRLLSGLVTPDNRLKLFTRAERELYLKGQREWARHAPGLSDAERRRLLESDKLYLDVLTEVYYAHAIDVAIAARSGRAAGADVTPSGAGVVSDEGSGGEGTETEAEGDESEDGEDPPDAFARADSLNERLQQEGRTVPGGSVRFVSASDLGVSMRRTYVHPIAIGWRGLTLVVDVETGAVSASASDGATPTEGAKSAMGKFADALELVLADGPLEGQGAVDVRWLAPEDPALRSNPEQIEEVEFVLFAPAEGEHFLLTQHLVDHLQDVLAKVSLGAEEQTDPLTQRLVELIEAEQFALVRRQTEGERED